MKKLHSTIILLLISNLTIACTCKWGGNFIRTGKNAELVLLVKVIEENFHLYNGKIFHNLEDTIHETFKSEYDNGKDEYWQSVDLEVLTVVKGEFKKKKIRLFGSFGGAVCRSGVRHMKKGKSYIIIPYLSKYTFDRFPNEMEDDYFMRGCSETSIEYLPELNMVYGSIKGKKFYRREIKYEYNKLLKKITKPNKELR